MVFAEIPYYHLQYLHHTEKFILLCDQTNSGTLYIGIRPQNHPLFGNYYWFLEYDGDTELVVRDNNNKAKGSIYFITGVNDSHYDNVRYIHIKFGDRKIKPSWCTLDRTQDKFDFVAPNLMVIDSKCFVMDSANKLYLIDSDKYEI